jgi:beta-N-acetylhexosaminidase
MTLGPLMIDVAGHRLTPEEREQLQSPLVGGVILFTRNWGDREQVRELVREIHGLRRPPLLVAVDQEGGRVQRFREGFTRLPPAHWLGREFDLDRSRGRALTRLTGWLMAAELLDLGIDLSFAPVVDLDYGLSAVIGDRAFHRDAESVAELAGAFMLGMRDAGMAAVAKHFPGHGAVTADSHLELPEDHRELADMDEDLWPYRRLIEMGLPGIMIAHVRYPRVDRRIASLSPYWLRTELRSNLGFTGAVFSDDLNMAGADSAGDMTARVRATLEAGADMALICNNPEAVAQVLNDLDADSGPASHGRLAAMRPHALTWETGRIADTQAWQDAVLALQEAMARPVLALDG